MNPVRACGQCQIQYPDAVEFCPRDGQKLPPVPGGTQALYDPLIGKTIDGRYTVEKLLGQGGMGYVYAARHAIIDKRVAIKVLRKDAAQDENAAQRFISEAKAASKIGHLNIVDITDFGVMPDGHAYFVMEYLEGPTLGRMLLEEKRLAPERVVSIAIQVARGLLAAHQKSIVHRDLKPDNIFVLPQEEAEVVKLVDFGIARDHSSKKRMTMAGVVLGTPEYMAPEQATGQETDHRVDEYALGCMMYEMLSGDVPFRGESATQTLTKHVFENAVPLRQRLEGSSVEVSGALIDVIEKMMRKKAVERYNDMREVITALEGAIGPGKATIANILTSQPPREPSQVLDVVPTKKIPKWPAAAAVAVLVVVGGWLAMRSSGETKKVVAQSTAAPPKIEKPANPEPATEAAREVEIAVESVPPGAEVFAGAERLGVTPAKLQRPKSTTPLNLSIKLAGYQTSELTIVPVNDSSLEAKLQKVAAPVAVAVAKRHPAGAVGKSGPAAHAPAPVAGPPPKKAAATRISDLRNPFD
jgi:serine/threonine-protein kinase